MADINLTGSTVNCVYAKSKIKDTGIGQQELVAAIYDLYQAVYAICNNIDEDSGTVGTDYLAKIGTPLYNALGTYLGKPGGKTTEA